MSDKKKLSNRMLSTYINTLSANGFKIDKLIEDIDSESAIASNSDFGRKALMMPTAFVIKSIKESQIIVGK